MQIADCKLQNEHWGGERSQFAICNLQFAICSLRPRRGITLTEVLISLGILTIGLLGVAALFPVGSYYMQRGEIADHGSALAQAAFNDAVARGVLNPERWLMWEDGKVSDIPNAADMSVTSRRSRFRRGFAELLRKQKAAQRDYTDKALAEKNTALEFGSVFVIDPLGVGSIAPPGEDDTVEFGSLFPVSNPTIRMGSGVLQWTPWADTTGAGVVGMRWPIRRLTLAATVGSNFDAAVTNRRFASSDDLALELSSQQDKPAVQRWELGNLDGGSVADDRLARQSRGDYSWLVTVSPTTPEARDGLATDPSAHFYEVSVVVFYKRPLGSSAPQTSDERFANLDFLKANERVTTARVVSTGLSGGEVLLTRIPPFSGSPTTPQEPEESPFEILKTGQWVLICGPHPNSTDERPMAVARWYRVLSIEGKADGVITDPANERVVALRGPQWPWQPAPYLTAAYNSYLSNALYVCIPTGAVAVHAKTIRLEGNSVWGGGGAASDSGSPLPGHPYGL
jgi:hypothetical protein